MKSIVIITFIFILTSCVPNSNRGTQKSTFVSSEIETCETNYITFDIEQNGYQCGDSCTQGQTTATDEEIEALLIDPSVSDELKELISTSLFVCVDEPEVETRPSNQVFLNDDFCICKNAEVASVNADQSCQSTCSTKNDTVATIYGQVSVGIDILTNENLQDLGGFCNNIIDNGAQTAPSCSLVVSDGTMDVAEIPVTTSTGSNSYRATLEGNGLSFDTTYTFRIVETGSGVEDARSGYEQFRLTETSDSLTPVTGDLGINIVNQYSCITRYAGVNGSLENSYYYPAGNIPPPLPAGAYVNLFCHDYIKDGENDEARFQRFNLIAGQFALWDEYDPRFVSSGDNTIADLLVTQEIEKQGVQVNQQKTYFQPMTLSFYPKLEEVGGTPEIIPAIAGYALSPFIDNDGKSFCPQYDEYKGTNPELVALGRVIGTPTEGLYLAKSEPQVLSTPDGQQSVSYNAMYIRETQLKKIWFHFGANQLPIKPSESTERQTAYFYWPPDYNNPYIKKPGFQKLYTVRSVREFQLEVGQSDAAITPVEGFTPHDRKIACVPQVSE